MRTLLALLACLVALGITAPLVMNHYFTGADGADNMDAAVTWLWEKASGETAAESRGPVLAALARCAEAEKRHYAAHGRYTRDLTNLPGLPAEVRQAVVSFDSGTQGTRTPYHGYLFSTVEWNGAARMDYGRDFVVIAFPAFYPVSGTRSFAVGPREIIIGGQTHGMPVDNATDFAQGWLPEPD